MKNLIKENPNDADLGKAIRKQYLANGDEALDLLKDVLLLHGNLHTDMPGSLVINSALVNIDARIIEFIKSREIQ